MRNQIDIDAEFSRAIIREIGERLQASLKEDELPPSFRVQLDSLGQLDDRQSPSIVPETGQLSIQETTTACNELRKTHPWRALRRRIFSKRRRWP